MSGPDDIVIPFSIADGSIRGRIIRLGPAADDILSAHAYDDIRASLTGELALAAALMGAGLKFDGRIILQLQTEGPVRLLVAEYATDGAVRATAGDGPAPAEKALSRALGRGAFTATIDQGADADRYQGTTPLEGETIADAVAAYFAQSEQIPTMARLALGTAQAPMQRPRWRAGGILIQKLPAEGGAAPAAADYEDLWVRAQAFLATAGDDELLDPSLSPERLLFRLFGEDGVIAYEARPVFARCRCNAGKIEAVLERYGEADLAGLMDAGVITVTCEFCRTRYQFDHKGKAIARDERQGIRGRA